MKLVTVAGPPSSGKTAVLLHLADCLQRQGEAAGVVKFDCLTSFDQLRYAEHGVPVKIGFSGKFCPDHYYVSNIEDALAWGKRMGLDWLLTESAGLCNRCSPYIKGVMAVCVIDCLAGMSTPRKIGPLVQFADLVVVTKGDIVSQAEREVFAHSIRAVNPQAAIIHVNGVTGQGAVLFYQYLLQTRDIDTLRDRRLRFPMPSAVCSYCTGETKIGDHYQMGMMRKMNFDSEDTLSAEEQVPPPPPVDEEAPPPCFRSLRTLTICHGHDKDGAPERLDCIVYPEQIVAIVGPTGSGKSQLLADIECLARGDTPTGRTILLNGEPASDQERFHPAEKPVAQLSQNMNFVADLTVAEFLRSHAESRGLPDAETLVRRCFACANDLSGEKFDMETKVTRLSGGQSRALMIADVALLSASPIVLIDEIENAGVDRRRAIELLAKSGKMIFLSTHDPLLALNTDKRVVIRNGAIAELRETTAAERDSLRQLAQLDRKLQACRDRLRDGREVTLTEEQEER